LTEHARTATPAGEQPPEPSFAEKVRTLTHLARVGTLSTHSRHSEGFPFGSVTPFGLDASGQPTFLISTMAMHTQNLAADSRASLLVTQPDWDEDPLAGARATLLGRVAPVAESDLSAIRENYLTRHESARYWVDFKDFSFQRMEVTDLYFVGGFGSMGWVEASEYKSATADPLADAAPGILSHMNQDHADALQLYCRVYAGHPAEEATMIAVDRLGFRVRAKHDGEVRGLRINFIREAASPDEVRKVLVEMVAHARRQVAAR
jgi:putative heme iron utilization protein